ncbi:MAG: hypothetical protein ACI9YT_000700 [Halobacteriales archaeon]
MTRRRSLSLVLATVAVLALVTSTGGVSSATVDRGVRIAVAPDHSAFLGFEPSTGTVTDGTTNVTLTVTNGFPSGTTLATVEVTVDGETRKLVANRSLGSGESAGATFENVACDARITVEASGAGVFVRLVRSVEYDR